MKDQAKKFAGGWGAVLVGGLVAGCVSAWGPGPYVPGWLLPAIGLAGAVWFVFVAVTGGGG